MGMNVLLRINGLKSGYGEGEVLHGLDLNIARLEVVSLLGRNGAGKSTALKSIMGMVEIISGSVLLLDRDVTRLRPYRLARLGIGYVPEERRIFNSLNVLENLEIATGIGGRAAWTLESVFDLFPSLANRRKSMGGQLSGGEQQMLCIARIVRQGARLLLLDEPTEGLAPLIVKVIHTVVMELKNHDLTVLLVEQNLPFTMSAADRHYIISKGRIVYEGTSQELENNTVAQKKYLAV